MFLRLYYVYYLLFIQYCLLMYLFWYHYQKNINMFMNESILAINLSLFNHLKADKSHKHRIILHFIFYHDQINKRSFWNFSITILSFIFTYFPKLIINQSLPQLFLFLFLIIVLSYWLLFKRWSTKFLPTSIRASCVLLLRIPAIFISFMPFSSSRYAKTQYQQYGTHEEISLGAGRLDYE